MKNWFVCITKYRQEVLAFKQLRKKGFNARIFKVFRHPTDEDFHHRGAMSLRFPGYIFVQFDLAEDPWETINDTRGVEQLLPKEKPLPMRVGEINDLIDLEESDFERAIQRYKPEARPDLAPGDKVRITDPHHDAYGEEGWLMSDHKGEAKVLIGSMAWPVADIHLKKIDTQKKKKQPERRAA